MSPLVYLPFFYFQHTRLNNFKAVVFHAAYEWLPAFLIAIYYFPSMGTVGDLLLYYLAFISIYEVGYVVNDQRAHTETQGRKRVGKLSTLQIAFFVGIRLGVFFFVTVIEVQTQSLLWWLWYVLLAVQFMLHNVLAIRSLKVITFSYLAFARFLSPVIMLFPVAVSSSLALPIFLNYVLFRLFTYMNSKDLLTNFDRKSTSYYRGFYLLIAPFSIMVGFLHATWVPLLFNLYYFVAAIGFTVLSVRIKSGSNQ